VFLKNAVDIDIRPSPILYGGKNLKKWTIFDAASWV
jgi:hypothetical protein